MYQPSGNLPDRMSPQVRSGASVMAIVCALLSFYFSSRHTQSLAFITAILAIAAGLLGGIRALSPRVSGGILSILAVVLGVIAILVAFLSFIF
jgi:hypothetical protein